MVAAVLLVGVDFLCQRICSWGFNFMSYSGHFLVGEDLVCRRNSTGGVIIMMCRVPIYNSIRFDPSMLDHIKAKRVVVFRQLCVHSYVDRFHT